MRRTVQTRQSGFVVTLELILIFTFLVIGSVVGVVAVRNALFKLVAAKALFEVVVEDADDPPHRLKPVSYDLCEAPQILCKDPDSGLFALLGIRPDRFVSRDRLYFSSTDCTGDAYLASPGDASLPVGYLNALQGVSYAAGPPGGALPWPACTLGVDCDAGELWRSTAVAPGVGVVTINSVWTSLNPDCYLLSSGTDPVVYDSPPTSPCQDLTATGSSFDAGTEGLLEAEEVLDGAANILARYAPLFSVPPPPDPTITYTPAVPEGAPIQGPGAGGSTDDGVAPDFTDDAGPEDAPPLPQPPP